MRFCDFFFLLFFWGEFLDFGPFAFCLFFFFCREKEEEEEQKSRDFLITQRELDTTKEAPALGRAVFYVVYVVEGARREHADETSRWCAGEICPTKTNDDDADEFLPVRFHHLETPRGWELRRSSNGEV